MGTGYTRNDTSNNIADGNVVNAADLDGEFDAVESAFSTLGHTHDGTAAEGGPVTVVGPAQDVVVSGTNVNPKTTNTLDLGTASLKYKDAYLQGNITVDGTVDGRDVATDGTKLDGVEANADVTDTANVTAAGALMDSELTDLAGVKGVTISTLQVKPVEGAFVDGDKTKLDGIEASADVTDTTNVTAAGALMDSELTDLAGVKGVTISTLQEKPSEGAFADGDKTKLDGIAASANNYVHPNHSGEVTSTADGATVIADNVVDEANLKVSNTPTDGYVLTAQSGNTGGLTWAEAATAGYTSSTSAPSSPANGDRWFESTNGILYIYIDSNWVDISTATAGGNATHTGEVTGATALTIADNVVDEANLKVSNAPTDGYFLSAQSGNTGGLTWAAAGGGGGGSMTHVSTATVSGTSTTEVIVAVDDTYNTYKLYASWEVLSDTNSSIEQRFTDGGTAVTDNAAYTGARQWNGSGGAVNGNGKMVTGYPDANLGIASQEWTIFMDGNNIKKVLFNYGITRANQASSVVAQGSFSPHNYTPSGNIDGISWKTVNTQFKAGSTFILYGLAE